MNEKNKQFPLVSCDRIYRIDRAHVFGHRGCRPFPAFHVWDLDGLAGVGRLANFDSVGFLYAHQ